MHSQSRLRINNRTLKIKLRMKDILKVSYREDPGETVWRVLLKLVPQRSVPGIVEGEARAQ